jgi:hypothetical protein
VLLSLHVSPLNRIGCPDTSMVSPSLALLIATWRSSLAVTVVVAAEADPTRTELVASVAPTFIAFLRVVK